jgi:hypothetical protein
VVDVSQAPQHKKKSWSLKQASNSESQVGRLEQAWPSHQLGGGRNEAFAESRKRAGSESLTRPSSKMPKGDEFDLCQRQKSQV